MSIDNADLIKRLNEALKELDAIDHLDSMLDGNFHVYNKVGEATNKIKSVVKDLESMVDDGK